MIEAHLSPERVEQFLKHRLSDEELEEFVTHLMDCDRCADLRDELQEGLEDFDALHGLRFADALAPYLISRFEHVGRQTLGKAWESFASRYSQVVIRVSEGIAAFLSEPGLDMPSGLTQQPLNVGVLRGGEKNESRLAGADITSPQMSMQMAFSDPSGVSLLRTAIDRRRRRVRVTATRGANDPTQLVVLLVPEGREEPAASFHGSGAVDATEITVTVPLQDAVGMFTLLAALVPE